MFIEQGRNVLPLKQKSLL